MMTIIRNGRSERKGVRRRSAGRSGEALALSAVQVLA
jgi:hypothetical protein